MASVPRPHELSRSPLHTQREHDFLSSECAARNSISLSLAHAWRLCQASIATADESSDLAGPCVCGLVKTSDDVLIGLYPAKPL